MFSQFQSLKHGYVRANHCLLLVHQSMRSLDQHQARLMSCVSSSSFCSYLNHSNKKILYLELFMHSNDKFPPVLSWSLSSPVVCASASPSRAFEARMWSDQLLNYFDVFFQTFQNTEWNEGVLIWIRLWFGSQHLWRFKGSAGKIVLRFFPSSLLF